MFVSELLSGSAATSEPCVRPGDFLVQVNRKAHGSTRPSLDRVVNAVRTTEVGDLLFLMFERANHTVAGKRGGDQGRADEQFEPSPRVDGARSSPLRKTKPKEDVLVLHLRRPSSKGSLGIQLEVENGHVTVQQVVRGRYGLPGACKFLLIH